MKAITLLMLSVGVFTSCTSRINQLEYEMEECLTIQEKLNERVSLLEEQVEELQIQNTELQSKISDLEFNELLR